MSKIVTTKLCKRIDSEFEKDKQITKKLLTHIRKIIDKHSEFLYKSGPFDRIYLKESDLSYVNEIFNIENKEIKGYISEIPFINSKWNALNNPFAFLMLAVMRHYYVDKKENERKTALFFLAIHYYAITHVRLFKFIQKETMEYTINNLSNKHDLKVYGTVFRALEKKLETFHTTYKYLLKSDDDKKLVDYLMNLNTRIFQWLRGILNEYVKNKNSGKYFNSAADNPDPENYRETSNISMDISRLVNNITMKITTNPTIFELCEKSAKINQISTVALLETLNQIKKSEDKRIKVLIFNIMQLFLTDGKNDVRDISSQKFLNYCLLLYNKSNTTNKSVITVKKILDEWLKEYSERYNKTERMATKINFRKALFMYHILAIQYFNNK